MKRRNLGRSGIAITPLMLGSNVFGWTADKAATFAVLDAYLDLGGNAIDTADSYSAWVPGHVGGESEAMIGSWLKSRGRRADVVIATKVAMHPQRQGIRRENIIAAAGDSLARLQIDTIDLYQLHRDDQQTPPEEYLEALQSLITAGKVRVVGASNFGAARFAEALAAAAGGGLPRFETQQPEYNLLSRDIEAELMPLCVREGVALIPYAGLAKGYLTGKYRGPADKAKSPRGGQVERYMNASGEAVLAALDTVSERNGASVAQNALAWAMAQPGVAATIASATSVAQLTELMGAIDVSLAAEDLAALNLAGD